MSDGTTHDALRIASFGGITGPFIAAGIASVVIASTTSAPISAGRSVLAALFLGFVGFDLAIAIGLSRARSKGRRTGNYSSIVVLPVLLLWLWLVAAAIRPGAAWTEQPALALAIGSAAIAIEVVGVKRLNRVGQPAD